MPVRRIKLNELANIIKAVIKEVEISDDVNMMLSNWNKRPNDDIDVILNRLELVSEKVGVGRVAFMRPKEEDSNLQPKTLFRKPIPIYIELPNKDEKTVIYDLIRHEYEVMSYADFYGRWLNKRKKI